MIISVSNVKDIKKGALAKKFDCTFDEIGLTIRECALFEKGSSRWINFPSRQYQDKDGKTKYFQYARFPDEKTQCEAQRYIIEKLDTHEISPDKEDYESQENARLSKENLPF